MVRFDPYDWAIHEDPYPTYRRLRDEAPVYHNVELGFWALSRYDDVLNGFKDTARLSSSRGVALEASVQSAHEVMSFLAMDPPRHDQIRGLVNRGFSPRRVKDLESHIRNLATHYIDTFIDKDECEFIAEFAGKLPMDVISEMVGVPPEDRDTLRTWADLVVHRKRGQTDVPAEGMAAAANLIHYFSKHVAIRRNLPADDLTDALIAADVEGDRLDDKEIIAFLFLMVIAGNETTTKLLANCLYWADKFPDQRKKVLENTKLIQPWSEETLRFDPSSQLIARTATCDIELHGRTIPEGAKVALLIGAANRDERFWTNPDVLDVERDTQGSVSFGYGTHFCLGASLAKLETWVSLEELVKRLGTIEVLEDETERIHSSSVRGFAKLPIEFRR